MEKWRHGDGGMKTWRHGDMITWRHGDMDKGTSDRKRKRKASAVFLYLLLFCPLCEWKFVDCPFVDKETNGSYPFANGLNRLVHLCIVVVRDGARTKYKLMGVMVYF
jgi:hypothetical protein